MEEGKRDRAERRRNLPSVPRNHPSSLPVPRFTAIVVGYLLSHSLAHSGQEMRGTKNEVLGIYSAKMQGNVLQESSVGDGYS